MFFFLLILISVTTTPFNSELIDLCCRKLHTDSIELNSAKLIDSHSIEWNTYVRAETKLVTLRESNALQSEWRHKMVNFMDERESVVFYFGAHGDDQSHRYGFCQVVHNGQSIYLFIIFCMASVAWTNKHIHLRISLTRNWKHWDTISFRFHRNPSKHILHLFRIHNSNMFTVQPFFTFFFSTNSDVRVESGSHSLSCVCESLMPYCEWIYCTLAHNNK